MRRSQTVFEPTSTPLEDRVPVTFRLVGSQQWFANDFEPRAVPRGGEDRHLRSRTASAHPR